MKDLKHYFAENVKACETRNVGATEVTDDSSITKTSAEEPREISSPATKRKRGRVKIKISKTNASEPVCAIVESKNDLIDKTPSPFTGSNVVAGTDESSRDDTPKRSNSLPRRTGKNGLVKAATRRASAKSDAEDKRPGDENDNLVSNVDNKSGEAHSADGNAVNVKVVPPPREIGAEFVFAEREESNAFQVLMTRKKPPQYVSPPALTVEDEESAARTAEESKMKLKQNKDKLIAMADKKGYSKRKLVEMEEAEKIERRLEKRARVFRVNGKNEGEDGSSPVGEQRVLPGSLHNYFSKTTPERKEKEQTATSTLVVKAEIHEPDSVSATKVRDIGEATMQIEKAETREAMARMDDIEIVESENVESQGMKGGRHSKQGLKKKPKWSLRINLQCSEQDAPEEPVKTDEKILSGRRESKRQRSKAKVDYDENEGSESEAANAKHSRKRKSPSTQQKTKLSTPKAETRASDVQAETSPIIVDVVESNEQENLQIQDCDIIVTKVVKSQTSEKLAPLFVKKQKPDPAVMEARRLFLHSVPTENDNPRSERKTPFVGVPLLPFPAISHVAQLSGESKNASSPLPCKFSLCDKVSSYTRAYNPKDFKSVTSLGRDSATNSQNSAELTKGNVEETLSEIEKNCSDAREIWNRISSTINGGEKPKSPRRKGKKRKSSEKKIVNGSSDEKIQNDGIWTRKYRPRCSGEIVGNEEAARTLHAWLDGWKAPLRKEEDSSGDEFYFSDCSYASDNNQVAVLLGPHGSGKTASVYAIAEELGYSVIEVNASSKRAGKKLLKELEEATKSHRIKKSEGISLLPASREKKAMPQNSLILVEDVDLIFEEDEGFINATCQLASNTKRPIVMTGRDTCSHLSRIAPQQLRIYYNSTVGSRVSALLELITLAESGYRLPRPCLERLLQSGDLRKALLQLQFLLLSGEPRASEVPTYFHRSLWQDMRYCIYKPAIRAAKKSSKKKNANSEKLSSPLDDEAVVTSLANDLESLSFLSTMIDVDEVALDISPLKFEPSMSLVENTQAYSSTSNTSVEISEWLRDRVMNDKGTMESSENDWQIARQLSLKKELNLGVNLALSQVSPNTLDGRVMALDYLPSLRHICRSEDLRVLTSNKRGNRFFHYLQNLRLPTTSTRPNILAAACKIFRDKSSDS